MRTSSLILLFLLSFSGLSSQVTIDDFLEDSYNQLPYRLYIPKNYDISKSYPLVLFLHGAGQRGDENIFQMDSYAMLFAQDSIQNIQACFVLVPQCPWYDQWVNSPWENGSYNIDETPLSAPLSKVIDIIGILKNDYSIDNSRVYVTGLSMGGYGTWDIISRYPLMFAAAIPICGAGDPSKANRIKHIPLQFFHSSDDPTVPVAGSRDMKNALITENAADFKYKEYDNLGHDCWTSAYFEPGLISWMFSKVNTSTLEHELLKEENFSVYPNPFFNQLTISFSSKIVVGKMELYSMHGQLVHSSAIRGFAEIPLHSISSGSYILKIQEPDGVYFKKLLKKN